MALTFTEKQEQLRFLCENQGWMCACCGASLSMSAQRAHYASQSKQNYKAFSKVVDSDQNVCAVCSLSCNNEMSMRVTSHVEFLGAISAPTYAGVAPAG